MSSDVEHVALFLFLLESVTAIRFLEHPKASQGIPRYVNLIEGVARRISERMLRAGRRFFSEWDSILGILSMLSLSIKGPDKRNAEEVEDWLNR